MSQNSEIRRNKGFIMQRMLRTHQTTNAFETHIKMNTFVKKLKPGQLCTISGIKYRCAKAVEETVPEYLQASFSCRECVKTNGYRACEDMYGGFSCAKRFGYNCYPKKLKPTK